MEIEQIEREARNVARAFREFATASKWTPNQKREVIRDGSRLVAIVAHHADEIARTLDESRDYTSQWEAFSGYFEDAYRLYFDAPKAPYYLIDRLYDALTGAY